MSETRSAVRPQKSVTGWPVVVGVDGSRPSEAALEWAAAEARLRGRDLSVVHAFEWPVLGIPFVPEEEASAADPRDAARDLVTRAVHRARELAPTVRVSGQVVPGPAARVLLRLSASATVTAVGHRGTGGFARLVAGSVAIQVAEHASGPVAVVRAAAETAPGSRTERPVVVGVDASPASELALEHAFDAAARYRVPLVVLHAWTAPAPATEAVPATHDPDAVRAAWRDRLDDLLASWRDKFPGVEVQPRVVPGRAASVLVDESARARLVVVGARGYGGFRGLLLGSVSQALIMHAHGPVTVVRAAGRQQRAAGGLAAGEAAIMII